MKQFLIIAFLLTFVQHVHTQHQPDSTELLEGDIGSIELLYGKYFYRQGLQNQINTFQYFRFSEPIQSIGLNFNVAYVRERRHDFTIHFSYTQIIPQKIQLNDSITGYINGFNFSNNLYGIDLTPKSDFSSIVLGLGFNTGRLRIKTDEYRSLKNPFFAPSLFFNPRFFFGHFSMAIRTDYQLDISKTHWRNIKLSNKSSTLSAPNLKQTALLTYLSLGWRF